MPVLPRLGLLTKEPVPIRNRDKEAQHWWVATVLPRALRFKRPLHHCNACNPIATRRRS